VLAVIGGSGLGRLAALDVRERRAVETPYGPPSASLVFGRLRGRETLFLARHGEGHRIPPHEINYRANLRALADAGASAVVAVASVGGIRQDLAPGTIVLPDQLIDYTWGRRGTFFDEGAPVTHVDFTEPYAPALRARIAAAAVRAGEPIVRGGVYAATQGPRLETAAEIDRLERDGAHMVGMTGMPEAALARELGLPYAAIAVVVNWAAGRGDSVRGVSLAAIEATQSRAMQRVERVLEALAEE